MATINELFAALKVEFDLLNAKVDAYFGVGQPIVATETTQPEPPSQAAPEAPVTSQKG